ncbi:MAG: hypothetical protein LBT16_08605 [Treponema sp.]|nr:hypothetical protein [Treponema sp.]
MKKLVLFAVFTAVSGLLAAQTAAELENILATREVTYSQAAFFVLTAANALPAADAGDALAAFTAARENRWLPPRAQADRPIRLGQLSLLIIKAFGLKGGIMYNVFPNSRYACRELVYLQIIPGESDPAGRVDGRTFLQILGRVLTHTGEEDIALAAEGGVSA